MGHCRDCCHYHARPDGWGCCLLARATSTGDARGVPYPNQPEHPETLAFAVGSSFAADLRVRPDFGCVQFEGKAISSSSETQG